MIIISQDKTLIMNFSNVCFIATDEEWENTIIARTDNNTTILGSYKTKERAKEVLNEIINCYAHTEQYKCFSNNSLENRVILNELTKGSFIYGMPKE